VNHFAVHPDNIRIVTADQIKVLDFGVASLFINHLNKSLPENFKTVYAPYNSPEHVLGRDLDIRSDIYSLGVLLFEFITGQSLYPSSLLVEEINNKILYETLPSINLFTQKFAGSHLMQAIVDKATAKDPSHRFQDFRELKESLLAEKNKREKNAIKSLRQEAKAGKKARSSDQILVGKPAKRNPMKMALLAIVLIIGTIVIGLFINHPLIDKSVTTLREKLDKIVGSFEQIDHTEGSANDDANEPDTAGVTKQRSKPAKKDLSSIPKAANSTKGSKVAVSEIATSRAGTSSEINSAKKLSKAQLQNRLEAFYKALGSKDINQVSGYYAPKLTYFFNESNVTKTQLQGLLLKAWRRTPEDAYDILWDTFEYDQDQEGNYTTKFYMNYVYRRANTNTRRSRKIHTVIKMDPNLKIFYMSGD
jgi:serine/threonine protein kinase